MNKPSWILVMACGVLFSSMLITSMPQASQSRPVFEVASVKPTGPDDKRFDIRDQPGGRFLANGITLKMLVALAYRVRDFQISGGPAWIDSEHWSIQAETAPSSIPMRNNATFLTTPDPIALRLQTLIEAQFQLKMHRESREAAVYELVVAGGGAKVRPAADQTPVELRDQALPSISALQLAIGGLPPPPPPPPGMALGGAPFRPPRGFVFVRRTEKGLTNYQSAATPIGNLVVYLSQQMKRPVVDLSQLDELYDFDLQWSPEPIGPAAEPHADSAASEPAGPTIFAALQEQLGLRLVSARAPVEFLVIDSAQRPH